MSKWKPIAEVPKDGAVAILYSAGRTYHTTEGVPAEPMGDGRDFGIMCDIATYMEGRWVEVYTGHDMIEPWDDDPEEHPTHYFILPPPPETDRG